MNLFLKVHEELVLCQFGQSEQSEVTFKLEVFQSSMTANFRAHVYRLEECSFLVSSDIYEPAKKEEAIHQVWVLDNFVWDPWEDIIDTDVESVLSAIHIRLKGFE